ncbi:olfactory receptor 5V1-like [Trachemys scripta elegans]|uniref:olfactory receptor 5V1-like n=1 Tax=Trachemys scripta elegans TaxID=31138 RepID=UPI0015549EC4|nr:olfactory receptor 5V1-like [Trachemys scripta elegans]
MADARNQTGVSEFILLGFSDHPQVQLILFVAFASAYAAALLGNVSIITVICSQPGLHTPMYFFLVNLSLLDIGCVTSTVPQMLKNLLAQKKAISFQGCLAQMYFFTAFLATELLLLTGMAFDRYVAICHPLRYSLVMSQRTCCHLAVGIWVSGFLISLPHTLSLLRLSFCGPNIINHFFCELPPLLQLSCSDTSYNQTLALVTDVFLGIGCFLLTLLSYVYIVSSVLKIQSAAGKRKAFSTCSSHVMVVTLFYSTVIYTYVRPPSAYLDRDKAVAALYTMVTPLVNPLIYSLRNKEVKEAFKKLMGGNRG